MIDPLFTVNPGRLGDAAWSLRFYLGCMGCMVGAHSISLSNIITPNFVWDVESVV